MLTLYIKIAVVFLYLKQKVNIYMKTLIVEGNIGAGKSTLLHILKQYLQVNIVYEPLTMWQHVTDDQNLLDNFYKNPKRWAYSFQSYAFITRIIKQKQERMQHPDKTQILERSVFSDRYCFAKNCYAQGFMSALEWKLYQEWFTWLVSEYVIKPDGIIYLRVEPEICHARLQRRARHEEESISLAYLTQLHNLHDNWLVNEQSMPYQEKIPVVTIDGDKEFATDIVQKERIIDKITSAFTLNIAPAQDTKKVVTAPIN